VFFGICCLSILIYITLAINGKKNAGQSASTSLLPYDKNSVVAARDEKNRIDKINTAKKNDNYKIQSDKYKLIASFERNDFELAWESAYNLSNGLKNKHICLIDVVLRMTAMGGEKEAINKITNSLGTGEIRSSLIKNIFYDSKNPSLMADLYANLSPDDKKAARAGSAGLIINAMMEAQTSGKFNLGQFSFLEKDLNTTLTKACQEFVWRSKDVPIKTMLETFESFKLDDNVLQTAYVEMSDSSPSEIVDYLNRKKIKLDQSSLFAIYSNLLTKPSVDFSQVLAEGSLLDSGTKINLMLNLLKQDANYQWKEIPENSDFNLLIYAAKVKLYSGNGDLSKAKEQLEKITDPVIRKQAEGQVWSKERNMLRNAANADPQKVLEEMVAGKSQHEDYWIEEAMDVWVSKDFDKAEQWYQDNWRTLPADKAQYVASSFAVRAIKAGDAAAAAQWIPFIQDPKTKNRIEGELKKIQQPK
jgi:hypothetical protein